MASDGDAAVPRLRKSVEKSDVSEECNGGSSDTSKAKNGTFSAFASTAFWGATLIN